MIISCRTKLTCFRLWSSSGMKYQHGLMKRWKSHRVRENWKSYKNWTQTTWERDWEMRESLFFSPHLLSFYSLSLRPAMCIWIWPAYFGLIPPRGSSNCPSVFGQAWKRADSIQSTMTREWRTQSLSFISTSAAGSAASTHAHRLTFLRQRSQMQNGPWKVLHRSMAWWFMRHCHSTTHQQYTARCTLV